MEELGTPLGGIEDQEDVEAEAAEPEPEPEPEPSPPPPQPEIGPPEPPPPPPPPEKPEGFWEEARWKLGLRTYEFARVNTTESRQETFAIGARLGFRSGRWKDRVRVGAAVYTSQRVHGPEDRDGLSMLRPRQIGLTALGEAWVGVQLTEGVEARVGRQAFDLPYLNRNDSRMIPNTFEGIGMLGNFESGRFVAGHVTRMKARGAGHFDSLSRVAGADIDRGVTLLGAAYEPADGLQIGALNLANWDIMNLFYAEARWTYTLPADLGVQLAVQFTDQRSIGREAIGRFATHQLGVQVATSFQNFLLTAAWAITDDDARIRSPWGGRPSFVSLMRSDFDRAGQRAWLLGISYDLGRIGWDGWSGFVNFAHGTDALDPTLGLRFEDEREIDVTLDYRPESGAFEGVWFRLRGAWLDTGGRRTARDIRLIVNYDLPL